MIIIIDDLGAISYSFFILSLKFINKQGIYNIHVLKSDNQLGLEVV